MIKRWSSDHVGPIKKHDDDLLLGSLKSVLPSEKEAYHGFKTSKRCECLTSPDVPVVLSETFNTNCMANREWDIRLNRLPKNTTYDPIICDLRGRSFALSRYLTAKFRKSIYTINPLTNDRKIGFFSPMVAGAKSVDIFPTDYFTGLCTEALTTKDLEGVNNAGNVDVKLKASTYCHIECRNGRAVRLLDFGDTSKPCSLQGGVEVIAVSKDYYLRLAIQATVAQFSGGTRAPLASGSMDWEDQEGCETLKQLICEAGRRELIEEWGKNHRTVLRFKKGKIQPIGFFRMPHRGGKPQFVVFARLENNDWDLRPDLAEVHADLADDAGARFKVPDLPSLQKAVTQMIEGGGRYKDSATIWRSALP